jgi:hypothetical protein
MCDNFLLQLTTNSDPAHEYLRSALNAVYYRKKVEYSIQDFCTAVTNKRYLTESK